MNRYLFLTLALSACLSFAAENLDDLLAVRPYPGPVETPDRVLIKGATVWTQESRGILQKADVLIVDGKIAKVGTNLRGGRDALVIEAEGKHVTPGMIDAHNHSPVEGGWAASVNEATNNITAEVRILDVFDPQSPAIYRELAGGLTAGNLLHGSANAIGGQNAIFKYRYGAATPNDYVIDSAPPGIKFALGENPIRVGGSDRYPNSRMGVNASIRNAFDAALDYRASWRAYEALAEADRAKTEPPRRNLQLDAIVEILEGKREIHSHGYRQDEFLGLLRLVERYGVRVATFQHVLEGYKIADEMVRHGVGGSTFADWWAYKFEAYDAIPQNAALMHERGVLTSVNSDDEVLARRMNIEAAKSVRYGMSRQEALALVTINPARQLGIGDRTGSLEKGKDADVLIWNGDPLSIYSRVDYTLVEGRIVFSREVDRAHRDKVAQTRAALVEAVKAAAKKEEKAKEKTGEEAGKEEDSEQKAEPEGTEPSEPGTESSREPDEETAAADAGSAESGEKKDEEESEPEEKPKPNPAPPKVAYALSPYAPADAVGVVGATVHTLAGDAIAKGVVVFQGGRITAVGGENTAVPQGARIYRADGKHLWPGIFHTYSILGLYEIGLVGETVDVGESGKFNPEIQSHLAFNPDSQLIPVARSAGITHVLVRTRGGNISGVSAVMKTDGWTWEDMSAVPRAVLTLGWPEGDSKKPTGERKKAAEKEMKKITEFFDSAEWYRKAKQAAGAADKPFRNDPKFEAMLPVLGNELPLYVDIRAGWAMKMVHKWTSKRGYRLVIVGADEAWKVADYLAEHDIPVILESALRSPDFADEPYDVGYTQPKKLQEAGVLFAIAGTEDSAAHLRNIIEHAGTAAGHGLDRKAAYRSITLNPARIFGLDADLGSIEQGKVANLVLTDGDLLEVTTVVEQVWVDGLQCDMSDKQKRLYQKYRDRPKAPNP